MRIFLDLDHTLIDFSKSVYRLFNVKSNVIQTEWEFHKLLNISKSSFWRRIDDAGCEFWANLEPYPWMDEMIEKVSKIDPDFHLLTSPSRNPECSKGKMIWIHKHFGWDFRNHIFAPAKSKKECAGPNKVLIDDKTSNIIDWDNHGGIGILFPQPWNTPVYLIPDASDIVDHVLLKLR